MKEYMDFLKQKQRRRIESGFVVEDSELNGMLFDFQKYCVKRALQAGKFALFEDCGLGKTIQQLEWAKQVCMKVHKPVLILAPLGVVPQTIKEGDKFGYKVSEVSLTVFDQDLSEGIYITNYDNLDNIDTYLFGGVVLDESSILKNFDGKTKQRIIDEFKDTPFLGIGSEVYQSILLGRKGIGFELKESYFNEAVKNVKMAEYEKNQKTLF